MLGLAVISGNNLVDYHIKLRKESWNVSKRDLILTSLQPWCTSYSINNIALSISYEKQTSRETKELLESIKKHFRERKIRICTYPSKILQTLCGEGEKKTKKMIMKKLAEQYPELRYYYLKEIGNKNKYYVKLFEAIGVATIHSNRLNKKDS